MRLPDHYPAVLRQTARDVFGEDAVVRLFGSRVDDAKRGGDIDLHVEASAKAANPRNESRFHGELDRRLDEDQVDVVVYARGAKRRWIDDVAFREGIVL